MATVWKKLLCSDSPTGDFPSGISTATGVEDNADVTDATNVTAAGALMDSECSSVSSLKAINQGLTTSSSVQFGNIGINTLPQFNLHIEGGAGNSAQFKLGADDGQKAQILSRQRGSSGIYNNLEVISQDIIFKTRRADATTSSVDALKIEEATNSSTPGKIQVQGTSRDYYLPTTDGSADQVVKTDGSGNLSFADQSGGGGTETFFWQWSMKWYMRYSYYYYPSSTYGVGYYNWNKNNSSELTTWQDSWSPCYVVPEDAIFKGAEIFGSTTSTETLELKIKSGTPTSWSNSSTSVALSSIYSPTAESFTSGRRNSMGSMSGATVSIARGDIIVPQLRKTSNAGVSSTKYLYGTLVLKFEKT